MTRASFGHIERLSEGLYRCHWMEGGSKRTHRVHGTLDDAKDFLAGVRIGAEGCTRATTWDEFWAGRVVPSFDGLEEKTVHEYRRLWERELAPLIGRSEVRGMSARRADAVLAGIASPSVQRAVKALGRKLCNMAIREGLLDRNPFEGAKVKRARPRRKEPYTPGEVLAWMDAVRGIKYEPVLLCELGAGLRHEEACALTWDDVSEWDGRAVLSVSKALTTVNGSPVLKGTKTARSEREAVLGEPFASRLLELRGDGALCPGSYEGYANPSTITHNYRTWCERHGVRYVCPKDLRSTFATLHAEAGSIDSLVSEAMGHTDGTTRGRHYQQTTRAGLALIADNLARYLDEAGEGA